MLFNASSDFVRFVNASNRTGVPAQLHGAAFVRDLRGAANATYLVGEFTLSDGRKAAVLHNQDEKADVDVAIGFASALGAVHRVVPTTGHMAPLRSPNVRLAAGGAAMFVAARLAAESGSKNIGQLHVQKTDDNEFGSAAGAQWPAPKGELNAQDFGAVGDGVADSTHSLQAAIDASQTSGHSLLIPGGHYLVTKQLNISCLTPGAPYHCAWSPSKDHCCNPVEGQYSCCTHSPARIRGEGQQLTHLIAAGRMQAVLNFQHVVNPLAACCTTPPTPGCTAECQPSYAGGYGHEVSDLHLRCSMPIGNHSSIQGTQAGPADYGICKCSRSLCVFFRSEASKKEAAAQMRRD